MKSVILRSIFWINDFFHGSPIKKQYKDVKKIFENKTTDCANIKMEHLLDLLKYATTFSDFYKGTDSSNLHCFPVVNKAILIENHKRVAIPFEHIPEQIGPLLIQRTSGSTGTPFAIPQDTRKRNRRVAELKYFGELVGFKSHDKLLQLRIWTRMQHKSWWQAHKENIVLFDISNLGEERMKELCKIIDREKPICIRGYVSNFDIIAEYVRKNNIKFPSLKIAIAGSEALQETTRNAVHQYIGCNIISQYADEECGILAQEAVETGNERFYLNQGSYVFELLKLDSDEPAEYGQIGRIVVTDLFNYAFPIIRYDTGDTAIMARGDAISNGYDYITNLYGRRADLIFKPDGTPISPMILSRTLKYYSEILQWQFIQESSQEYILRIIIRQNQTLNEKQIINQLSDYLGKEALLRIEYANEIPCLQSGKQRPIVNKWKSL